VTPHLDHELAAPTLGVFEGGSRAGGAHDLQQALAIAYYRWGEEMRETSGGRVHISGPVPLNDITRAVETDRRSLRHLDFAAVHRPLRHGAQVRALSWSVGGAERRSNPGRISTGGTRLLCRARNDSTELLTGFDTSPL